MLIVIPKPEGSSCGLADHARVMAAALSCRCINISLCPWPRPWLPARGKAVLLEFTPLAYSRFGLPWRLLQRVLCSRLLGGRVVTYFHELPFTNGTTWRRRFAVILQRGFCVILAALSNQVLVNQHGGMRWLALLRPRSRPIFLPSCSNVGESEQVPEPSERPLQVVIFGSPGKRRHAHELVAELGGYRRLFGATVKVLDIGELLALPVSLHGEVDILGSLPPDEVFAHLLQCRYGFFYAEPHQFSKSGVFAAYCAAGVVPIIAFRASGHSDYYLSPRDLVLPSFADVSSAVWMNCRTWSSRYSVEASVNQLCSLLGEHYGCLGSSGGPGVLRRADSFEPLDFVE